MIETLIINLIDELRGEFKIPPYYEDDALTDYLKEGDAYLTDLVANINYDNDLLARSLLKNYCYYAYFKKLDEFNEVYNASIIKWQMSKIGDLDEKD